jgi:hypothetical protein
MRKKEIYFVGINGDLAAEKALGVLANNGFKDRVLCFNWGEIRFSQEVLFVVFFTPTNKAFLGDSNINPVAHLFLGQGIKETKISYFLVACNPEKMEEMAFSSAVINIATRYFKWWQNNCSFSDNSFFPPWGNPPKYYPQKDVFDKWLWEVKCFW